MPAATVPSTPFATGAGYLYTAPVGTPIPGAQTATVTNKALTSNVATLTFASHSFIVGQQITVALSPADPVFDGAQTVTGVTATTITYAKTNANVTSTAAAGTVTGATPGGVVTGSVFVDPWPAAWSLVGATKEGSTFEYQLNTDPITVAEYLDPLRFVSTGRTIQVSFEMAVLSNTRIQYAFNGGTTSTSGTGATTLTSYSPPVVGAEVRRIIGWESEDFTERMFWYQCLQGGQVSVARRKGSDYATLPVQFNVEQPASGAPFNWYLAGVARAA